jgi:diguanylate cyclase (GGDEF)-like protein
VRLTRSSSLETRDRAVLPALGGKVSAAEGLRRERCLLGLANATRVLLRHSNLSAAFPRALEHLRAALEVDRLYVCEHLVPHASADDGEHSPSSDLRFSLRFEAMAKGAIAHAGRWQDFSYTEAGLCRWRSAFEARQSIGGLLEAFPVEEQVLLQRYQVQSALMVPIFLSEIELWGYIGCEVCDRPRVWLQSEQSTLAALADNFSSAIRRQRTEEQVQHQAFHDLLTGLPNRMLFNHRLPLAIAHARRTQEPLAVMFLDLDRFKHVNDSLGHEYGDQLLVQATQRLQTCLREEDIFARWGGDEFTLCLPNLQSSDDVIKICQRLLAVLRQPFAIADQQLEISGSIGIAIYPQDGDEVQALLRSADTALYRVKEEGRDHCQFFRPEMNSLASEQTGWAIALQAALQGAILRSPNRSSELQLQYQPQVYLGDGRTRSLEAFLRWQHPERGLLSAAEFLPHAKQAGMMVELGEWVIESVCEQLRLWQFAGLALESVSINLSDEQFRSSAVMATIARSYTPDSRIKLALELDEATLYQDLRYTKSALRELNQLGVGIILHQFGLGQIGLGQIGIEALAQLPIGRLKLDRRLIEGLKAETSHPKSHSESHSEMQTKALKARTQRTVVGALLGLGQSLSLPVVAQGVESAEQLTVLRSLHCPEAQGNFISPLLPAADVAAYVLQEGRRLAEGPSDQVSK